MILALISSNSRREIAAFGKVNFRDKNIIFGFGAATASFVFFFTLGYASRVLLPFFKKPISWKILEIFIGFLMMFLAFLLLFSKI
ncbi:LysE family transporter [Campylobacter gastrosuis]|uniref:LysE family transporter n=1 Tax=Campylobacter gastrosuis TaxID=2974576 RepID=UPI00254BD3B0|nr:LysE family transporter [Campylobacter gastrosuis]